MGDESESDPVVVPGTRQEGEGTVVDVQQLITAAEGGVGVNYYFPVSIEVRSVSAEVNTDEIIDQTLERLADSVDGE